MVVTRNQRVLLHDWEVRVVDQKNEKVETINVISHSRLSPVAELPKNKVMLSGKVINTREHVLHTVYDTDKGKAVTTVEINSVKGEKTDE